MIMRVRELYWAKPFKAFTIHLADGRSVNVSHPEFMAQDPDGRTVSVYQADGSLHTLNVAQVTDVSVNADKAVASS